MAGLEDGASIAVIGGGPAGSLFALWAFHYARRRGIALDITIYEPRDFTGPSPGACNMCAGLIPQAVLDDLAVLGLTPPPEVIQCRIRSYTLHGRTARTTVRHVNPRMGVVSVFRGSGPRLGPPQPRASFDGWLLTRALAAGARWQHEAVTRLEAGPPFVVTSPSGARPARLAVLAWGVNGRLPELRGLSYRLPRTERMAQDELRSSEPWSACSGGEGTVDIFLLGSDRLQFGTLVPKGQYLNVSLLGRGLTGDPVGEFLSRPAVSASLPSDFTRTCGCRPRVSVSRASQWYGHGYVAVGDAGVTRLYKNGIGSAVRTSRRAAHTAVYHGVRTRDWRLHYAPLCLLISADNLLGRLIFRTVHVFERHSLLFAPHLRLAALEQRLPPSMRAESGMLWGLFTGTQSYARVLAHLLIPTLSLGLMAMFGSEVWRRLRRRAPALLPSPAPDRPPLDGEA